MSEVLEQKNKVDAAVNKYEDLIAEEYVDVFVLDEALMEAYEAQSVYVRMLERELNL